MKTKTFFQACREMTEFRWVVRFGKQGEIWVNRIWAEGCGELSRVPPVIAVALEVEGTPALRMPEEDAAIELLGLPPEFALMVCQASHTEPEVRQELVQSLTNPRRFVCIPR